MIIRFMILYLKQSRSGQSTWGTLISFLIFQSRLSFCKGSSPRFSIEDLKKTYQNPDSFASSWVVTDGPLHVLFIFLWFPFALTSFSCSLLLMSRSLSWRAQQPLHSKPQASKNSPYHAVIFEHLGTSIALLLIFNSHHCLWDRKCDEEACQHHWHHAFSRDITCVRKGVSDTTRKTPFVAHSVWFEGFVSATRSFIFSVFIAVLFWHSLLHFRSQRAFLAFHANSSLVCVWSHHFAKILLVWSFQKRSHLPFSGWKSDGCLTYVNDDQTEMHYCHNKILLVQFSYTCLTLDFSLFSNESGKGKHVLCESSQAASNQLPGPIANYPFKRVCVGHSQECSVLDHHPEKIVTGKESCFSSSGDAAPIFLMTRH